MASEELGRTQPQRMENGASSRIVFQDEGLHFPHAGGDQSSRKLRGPGFILDDGKMFSNVDGRLLRAHGLHVRRGLYGSLGSMGRDHHLQSRQSWNADGDGSDGDEDDGDEDDDAEDDDLDEGDGEVDGLVSVDGGNTKNNNNSSGSVQSSSEKIHSEKANLQDHHSFFGSSREGMATDLNGIPQHRQEPMGNYENAITVVEPELDCSRVLYGGERWSFAQKEQGGEIGYGFGGRREMSLPVDPGEPLRTHLSDPITGVLMDDAMILSCGHSFGSSGMQHIYRIKACSKCSQPISEDSVRPNLSLRAAVQAFRREEESQSARASKRRRDRFEQDKCIYDDSFPMDSRGKGVQFPFVVSDRVIIKGNKRTPQRFVGRVAVVTTQCLNGWYVVKTLDNAESVKLQYRSLAKVADESPSNIIPNKSIPSNWL